MSAAPFEHREYDVIDPAGMAIDPVAWAQENAMVGSHRADAFAAVGVWRWPLLHEPPIPEVLRRWIDEADRIIDFGGAAGPMGYGAIVVDRQADIRSLDDVEGQVDLIFTAHTLEHVRDLGLALCSFHWKLPIGGRVIVLVPSWQNESLRAENHIHHAHTFCLSADTDTEPYWIKLDDLLIEHGFGLHIVAQGHGNILIAGEKLR